MSAPTSSPQPLFGTARLLIFAAASALAGAAPGWLLGGHIGLWLALAAIAVAIWHGAFDGVLAEEAFQPHYGKHWKPFFYITYLALGALVLLLWRWAPVVALPAFLLYSAFHFGTETERDLSPARIVTGLATGFVPIAAACHWWPQHVATIFALMLRSDAAALTSVAGHALWAVVAVALFGALTSQSFQWLTSGALIATELLLFRACSPVVAFAIFFCLWHTPDHMLSTSTDRSGHYRSQLLLDHLRRGAAPWLVSLLGIVSACWLGRHEVQSYTGTVFIALSAFTVPHMVLAELCRRQARPLPQARKLIASSQPMVIR